jgi:hypothetical protein
VAESELLTWVARLAAGLDGAGVAHALAGGLALAVHAHARATVDIDIVVAADAESIERARIACADLGVLQTRRAIVAFKRLSMVRMVVPPAAGPEPIAVDLLLAPAALPVLARARRHTLGKQRIPVVSPEDLVLLKMLRASDQDVVDVRAIAAERALDTPYLERTARALGVLMRLRRALPLVTPAAARRSPRR